MRTSGESHRFAPRRILFSLMAIAPRCSAVRIAVRAYSLVPSHVGWRVLIDWICIARRERPFPCGGSRKSARPKSPARSLRVSSSRSAQPRDGLCRRSRTGFRSSRFAPSAQVSGPLIELRFRSRAVLRRRPLRIQTSIGTAFQRRYISLRATESKISPSATKKRGDAGCHKASPNSANKIVPGTIPIMLAIK